MGKGYITPTKGCCDSVVGKGPVRALLFARMLEKKTRRLFTLERNICRENLGAGFRRDSDLDMQPQPSNQDVLTMSDEQTLPTKNHTKRKEVNAQILEPVSVGPLGVHLQGKNSFTAHIKLRGL